MFFIVCLFVFFFKQKTAYEMRISDWSSDVCSSDLQHVDRRSLLAAIFIFVAVHNLRALKHFCAPVETGAAWKMRGQPRFRLETAVIRRPWAWRGRSA